MPGLLQVGSGRDPELYVKGRIILIDILKDGAEDGFFKATVRDAGRAAGANASRLTIKLQVCHQLTGYLHAPVDRHLIEQRKIQVPRRRQVFRVPCIQGERKRSE